MHQYIQIPYIPVPQFSPSLIYPANNALFSSLWMLVVACKLYCQTAIFNRMKRARNIVATMTKRLCSACLLDRFHFLSSEDPCAAIWLHYTAPGWKKVLGYGLYWYIYIPSHIISSRMQVCMYVCMYVQLCFFLALALSTLSYFRGGKMIYGVRGGLRGERGGYIYVAFCTLLFVFAFGNGMEARRDEWRMEMQMGVLDVVCGWWDKVRAWRREDISLLIPYLKGTNGERYVTYAWGRRGGYAYCWYWIWLISLVLYIRYLRG